MAHSGSGPGLGKEREQPVCAMRESPKGVGDGTNRGEGLPDALNRPRLSLRPYAGRGSSLPGQVLRLRAKGWPRP